MDDTLSIAWSPVRNPAWDSDAQAYVDAGAVGWGHSRRLARADDPALGLRAYLGVHHFDPLRWGRDAPAQASFFCSLLLGGRTLGLRTFPTLADALAFLRTSHAALQARRG